MALLAGSPAIDTGDDASAPAVDQRGFPRPIGPVADIGAFEYGSPALLTITRSEASGFDILVTGKRGQTCRLLASETLLDWRPVATNQVGPNGTVLFRDAGNTAQRFYSVFLP